MEPQVSQKKIAPVWALIALIIIAGIVFLAFRPTQQADAPTVEDMVATSTDAVATTTPADEAPVAPTPTPAPAVSAPSAAAPTTIQGDGYVATVTSVTGVAPTIVSFALRQEAAGEACIMTWEVDDATTCEVRNVSAKTTVRNVPDEGTLQTFDTGTYQLICKGTGGKTTTSTEVVCK